MGRETPKLNLQPVECYWLKSAENTVAVVTPTWTVENVLPTVTPTWTVESSIEPKELGGEVTAAALSHVLMTVMEHVFEAAIHCHGFGVLLKFMEWVVTLCEAAAAEEGRRQANDDGLDT